MQNDSYFIEKKPKTFQSFLSILERSGEAPQNYRVLYRGQNDKKWQVNSTLARPLAQIPEPIRTISAFEEMRLYFERNVPSDELLVFEKRGVDPVYALGKHLQQNPQSKKIKDKPPDKKIATPFIDFSRDPLVALFFANHELKGLQDQTFSSSLERKTDGALFVIQVSSAWIKRNFEEVVNYIVSHLKQDHLAPPIFWDPCFNLNDLDDQKAKRQRAEYVFHSSLSLSIEAFACEELQITKIILKKEWFDEASKLLISGGYTLSYLFPGHVLVDSVS